jgi:hypothetical protein
MQSMKPTNGEDPDIMQSRKPTVERIKISCRAGNQQWRGSKYHAEQETNSGEDLDIMQSRKPTVERILTWIDEKSLF